MKVKAWIFLVAANLFWAGNLIFGKAVTADFPPVWASFLRWAIAAVVLIPMAQLVEKPNWLKVWRNNWGLLLFLSIVGVMFYTLLTYTALEHTSSTNGSLINSLTPAVMIVLSLLFLKDKISAWQGGGLVLSFLGVLTVLTKGHLLGVFSTHYNRGDGILLVAVFLWATYSIISKRVQHLPPITFVAFTALLGVICMAPLLFIQPLQTEHITAIGITGVLYLGLFPSIGSFLFWNQGVKMLGPGKASITMNLMPIFTAILSVITGQALLVSQIVGGVIVIAGMLMSANLMVRSGKAGTKRVSKKHTGIQRKGQPSKPLEL
ncbi:DMT family transporter [Paenibacillus sacheonensis]|uniref:EamA family transporter n=1 Tax=Paenibacillus sacheonensis TaxID=742054 RepID=A0A7X4YUT3_9BACL|nr:DMT family transporter [Paenibacillus sacheonensis]MBM7569185.1 drug/metabolite transporter (DMT)-like permease [Paenibacillus sacheonensis]NBC73010.1 EamA family transporter [Paenibacillus sacheonensis]